MNSIFLTPIIRIENARFNIQILYNKCSARRALGILLSSFLVFRKETISVFPLEVPFSEKFETETKPIPMKWQLQKPNTKPIFILPKIPIFNQILTRASSKYR